MWLCTPHTSPSDSFVIWQQGHLVNLWAVELSTLHSHCCSGERLVAWAKKTAFTRKNTYKLRWTGGHKVSDHEKWAFPVKFIEILANFHEWRWSCIWKVLCLSPKNPASDRYHINLGINFLFIRLKSHWFLSLLPTGINQKPFLLCDFLMSGSVQTLVIISSGPVKTCNTYTH